VNTVAIESGDDVDLVGLTITRTDLANTFRTINLGEDQSVRIEDCDLNGGPIGDGGQGGNYEILDTEISGTGDEAIWIYPQANEISIRNNTVRRTDNGISSDDRKGIAVYGASTSLELEGNDLRVDGAAYLLGDDVPIRHDGTTRSLTTASDMRSVLERNVIDGASPGQMTFVAQDDGTLRTNADGLHIVRTGITTVPGGGGAGTYTQSALQVADGGDIIHLTGGTTYSENVTLSASNPGAARQDKNIGFAAPSSPSETTATIANLTLDGAYTVSVPSGEVEIANSLTLGDGSALTGSPIVLGDGAGLTDNGLASGSIRATRTVGDGERVSFGGIGLTLTEDGGPNAPGETTVTRTDGDPVTKGDGSIERYYDVSAAKSNLSVDLTFEYDDDELNGIAEGQLRLFRSDDQGGSWAQIGTASPNEQDNTLTNETLSSFSRFTAAAEGASLPVELARLEATSDGGAVRLRWTTASETNNAGFRVQRKTEGEYETLAFVDGAGTSTQSTTYTHRVTDLDPGAHTFRLQQVDQDGTTHFSDPVSVRLGLEGQYEVSPVAPNPVATRTQVQVAVQRAQDVTVALYDALGRRVTTLHTGTMAAETTHRLGVDTQGLSSGTYFLRVDGEAFRATRRVVVVR
jgi:hypothetical protein